MEKSAYQERYEEVVRALVNNNMQVHGWMKYVITPQDFKKAFLEALETEPQTIIY